MNRPVVHVARVQCQRSSSFVEQELAGEPVSRCDVMRIEGDNLVASEQSIPDPDLGDASHKATARFIDFLSTNP